MSRIIKIVLGILALICIGVIAAVAIYSYRANHVTAPTVTQNAPQSSNKSGSSSQPSQKPQSGSSNGSGSSTPAPAHNSQSSVSSNSSSSSSSSAGNSSAATGTGAGTASTTQPNGQLSNTGPGSVSLMFLVSTLLATVSAYAYQWRRLQRAA